LVLFSFYKEGERTGKQSSAWGGVEDTEEEGGGGQGGGRKGEYEEGGQRMRTETEDKGEETCRRTGREDRMRKKEREMQ